MTYSRVTKFSLAAFLVLMLPLITYSGSKVMAQSSGTVTVTSQEPDGTVTTSTTTTVITITDLSKTDAIAEAQRVLRVRGYYHGDINGLMTDRFRDALEEFQEDHKLAETRSLDIPTARLLGLEDWIVARRTVVVPDTAATIVRVQTLLHDRGFYTGPISGILDDDTRAALRSYQEEMKLDMSGAIDSATLNALGIVVTPATVIAPVAIRTHRVMALGSVDSVMLAQQILRDRGYYKGKINGRLNDETRDAIENFQEDHNLKETRRLDEPTARMLGIEFEVIRY